MFVRVELFPRVYAACITVVRAGILCLKERLIAKKRPVEVYVIIENDMEDYLVDDIPNVNNEVSLIDIRYHDRRTRNVPCFQMS